MKTTRHLLLLNGIAVLGAVITHASGWGYTSLFWWTDRYEAVSVPDFSQLGTANYYLLRVLEQLVIFSVPAFLFVSGFFVAFAAGRDGRAFGWRKVASRIRMLFVPYLLWSIAILVGRSLEGSSRGPSSFLEQLLFGRAAEPYYYIPLITQLYVLAFVVVPWMKDHWRPVLAVAGLVQLATQLARYPVLLGWDSPVASWVYEHTPGWFFPNMVFWFMFGMFVGFNLPAVKAWIARWRLVLPWATAALGIMALVEWEVLFRLSGRQWLAPTPTLLDSLYDAAFILTFLSFADATLKFRRPFDWLGERSFGIYLIQAPALELISRVAYHAAPLLLGHQFVFQPLLVAVGLAVPILIMAAINRSPARPYYNYLFG